MGNIQGKMDTACPCVPTLGARGGFGILWTHGVVGDTRWIIFCGDTGTRVGTRCGFGISRRRGGLKPDFYPGNIISGETLFGLVAGTLLGHGING